MEIRDMAQALEATGDYKVLTRYRQPERYNEDDGGEKRTGLILDVETTGLNHKLDQVIELGMVRFEYCPHTGRVFRILDVFDAFNDPGRPIPPDITRLTGITDDMVRGQQIDQEALAAFVAPVNLVIAHNAGFDRKFAESLHPSFAERHWACSMSQVNWDQEGIAGRKLDYIAFRLGFFFDHHRAASDCLATLHMLSHALPVSGRPALLALLEAARQKSLRIYAVDTRFEMKDVLRERGYRWSDGSNGKPRAWYIEVPAGERAEEELNYLKSSIYKLPVLNLPQEEITARNRFSDRA